MTMDDTKVYQSILAATMNGALSWEDSGSAFSASIGPATVRLGGTAESPTVTVEALSGQLHSWRGSRARDLRDAVIESRRRNQAAQRDAEIQAFQDALREVAS